LVWNFKALENKNAAAISGAWLLHGAATEFDSRSQPMFVLPRSPSHRAAVPAFSRSLERLLDESRERQSGLAVDEAPLRTPAMDVTESDSHYTVSFDMPGLSREQLRVSVEGRRVSVETTPADPTATGVTPTAALEAGSSTRALYRERSPARYARTVNLPAEVDQITSRAKLDNGVLTLTLAKRVASGATRLNVI
jgi:HSP20 family protein